MIPRTISRPLNLLCHLPAHSRADSRPSKADQCRQRRVKGRFDVRVGAFREFSSVGPGFTPFPRNSSHFWRVRRKLHPVPGVVRSHGESRDTHTIAHTCVVPREKCEQFFMGNCKGTGLFISKETRGMKRPNMGVEPTGFRWLLDKMHITF